MFEAKELETQFKFPFAQGAVKVLDKSAEEAEKFGHNYIGTEHLLLGLIALQEVEPLEKLGVGKYRIKEATEFIIGRGNRAVPTGELELTPRAKKSLRLGTDEAKALKHETLEPDHILLGLLREGEGIAAGVLESMELSIERVRNSVIAVRYSKWNEVQKKEVQETQEPEILQPLNRIRTYLLDPASDQINKEFITDVLKMLVNAKLPGSHKTP